MSIFSRYDTPALSSRIAMAICDLLSLLLVPLKPHPRLPLNKGEIRKLLLLRLDGIGDNVCSWPALQLLRENLPDSHITLAVGSWATRLYDECPWVDEVIEWDSGLFGLFRGNGLSGLSNDIRLAGELRKRGFDAGIDLRGDILSIALLRLIAPPIRIASISRGGGRLLTDPLRIPGVHEAQLNYNLARVAMGLPPEQVSPVRDWQRPQALARAQKRLSSAGWDNTGISIALSPLALWPWKQWPRERFISLADRLKNEGLKVVWFLETPDQAPEYSRNDPLFCGPLDEVAAALSLCRLAVANDSGLMHMAVAAGCRTVQLFGPGDANRFAHSGEGMAVHHDTTCIHYPCRRSGECANLKEGWCMEKISVDDVFDSCMRLIATLS